MGGPANRGRPAGAGRRAASERQRTRLSDQVGLAFEAYVRQPPRMCAEPARR